MRLAIDEVKDLVRYNRSKVGACYCYLDRRMVTCSDICSCYINIVKGKYSGCIRTSFMSAVK